MAKELSRAGMGALVLEKGKAHSRMGSYLTALGIFEGRGMLRTKEGMTVMRAMTAGGASVIYSASAADPPPWLASKYGLDLEPWVEEIKRETKAGILPERLWGTASTRVIGRMRTS